MFTIKEKDALIIKTYFRSTRGIKGTAGVLGLSKSYVGKIISQYKKKHGLR
jgi:DNA-directed RNA polymerase specialized sigma subunit